MTTNEEKAALSDLIDQLRGLSAKLSHALDTSELDAEIDELANEVGSIEPEDGESTGSEESSTDQAGESTDQAGESTEPGRFGDHVSAPAGADEGLATTAETVAAAADENAGVPAAPADQGPAA